MLEIRPATLGDAALLLFWRNHPDTRRWFLDAQAVAWEVHLAWLRKALADPARAVLMAEADGVPVGTAKLEPRNGGAEISVTVAPEHRGRGLGRRIIDAATREGLARWPSVVARVNEGNEASLRAFRACGYEEVGTKDGVWTLRHDGEQAERGVC